MKQIGHSGGVDKRVPRGYVNNYSLRGRNETSIKSYFMMSLQHFQNALHNKANFEVSPSPTPSNKHNSSPQEIIQKASKHFPSPSRTDSFLQQEEDEIKHALLYMEIAFFSL